jgi:methionyl aminopeptidase
LVSIKSKREIELMQEACRITAKTYEMLEKNIKPGMTTYDLDQMAEKFIKEQGGIPAQKGYPSGVRGVPNFPGTLCVSINDVVIHGIPSKDIIIKDGDVVSVDLVVLKNGYHGDAARTFAVGNISEEAQKLIDVTRECFFEGIKMAKVGYRLSDLSNAIQQYVEANGFSVVREFVGHGIGRELHEDPQVPNYGKPGHGPRFTKGMVIAVEPMVNAGHYDIDILNDRWTVVTSDGSLSAHYENTLVVTDEEPEILTML